MSAPGGAGDPLDSNARSHGSERLEGCAGSTGSRLQRPRPLAGAFSDIDVGEIAEHLWEASHAAGPASTP